MKERSDQDDKRLTKEERQREGHAMQSEKNRCAPAMTDDFYKKVLDNLLHTCYTNKA